MGYAVSQPCTLLVAVDALLVEAGVNPGTAPLFDPAWRFHPPHPLTEAAEDLAWLASLVTRLLETEELDAALLSLPTAWHRATRDSLRQLILQRSEHPVCEGLLFIPSALSKIFGLGKTTAVILEYGHDALISVITKGAIKEVIPVASVWPSEECGAEEAASMRTEEILAAAGPGNALFDSHVQAAGLVLEKTRELQRKRTPTAGSAIISGKALTSLRFKEQLTEQIAEVHGVAVKDAFLIEAPSAYLGCCVLSSIVASNLLYSGTDAGEVGWNSCEGSAEMSVVVE